MKKILLFLVLLMPMLASAATIKDGDWFKDYTPEGYLMQFVAYTNVYTEKLCAQCASGNPGYSSCITAAYGKVTIPSYAKGLKVTHVNSQAFKELDGMTELVIPSTVEYVDALCAQYCYSIRKVTCNATIPPTIDSNEDAKWHLFDWTTEEYGTLYVPKGCVSKYQSAKGWRNFKTIKEIGADDGMEINETNFPDENFRSWLKNQDYGSDGILTEEEIASVTKISVSEENIQSLQGIEFFTALTSLDCYSNQLTSLDLSKNTALTSLDCYSNQLTSLDLSKNTALTWLFCYGNQLTSLDVSKNTALTMLSCHGNQLTSLDVTKNTALTYLHCYGNQLTSLDVSKNTALTTLNCHTNQLTSLDVSKNTALTWLSCHSNQIKGAAMDTLVNSLPTISSDAMRVINNENEGNVMTTTQVAAAKAKGWTPQYYTGSEWQEYAGSEPEPEPTPVPLKICATPTITFVDGELQFDCETEGVEYSYIITGPAVIGNGNKISLPTTYHVSVHAEKEGYSPSMTAMKEINVGGAGGIRGDVNLDGTVGMPDAMFIVNYVLNGKFPDEEEPMTYYYYAGWTLPTESNIGTIINETLPENSGSSTLNNCGKKTTSKSSMDFSSNTLYNVNGRDYYYVLVPEGQTIVDPENVDVTENYTSQGTITIGNQSHVIYKSNMTTRYINDITIY